MAKIGIIGAMELEVDALKAAMEVKNTVTALTSLLCAPESER